MQYKTLFTKKNTTFSTYKEIKNVLCTLRGYTYNFDLIWFLQMQVHVHCS